jgi:hypothetical protein
MATLVLECKTLPDPLSSYFVAPRIAVSAPKRGGEVTLSPIIDPNDYDNDTDYINAVPGYAEKILAARAAPASERVTYDKLWDDDDDV